MNPFFFRSNIFEGNYDAGSIIPVGRNYHDLLSIVSYIRDVLMNPAAQF